MLFTLFGNQTTVSAIYSGQYSLRGVNDYYLGSLTSAYWLHFSGQASDNDEMVVSILTTHLNEKVCLTSFSGKNINFNWIIPGPGEYWLRISSSQAVTVIFACQVYRQSYIGSIIGVFLTFLTTSHWLTKRVEHYEGSARNS